MKKGLSLIEILAALAIGAILLSMQLEAAAYGIKAFKQNTQTFKEDLYVNEALLFVEGKINEANFVSLYGNEISIYSIDTLEDKEIKNTRVIKKNNDKLIILYYEDGVFKGENTIIKNISEFMVERRNNLVFVTLVSIKGEEGRICFGISIKD